jgi:hypothetical protein
LIGPASFLLTLHLRTPDSAVLPTKDEKEKSFAEVSESYENPAYTSRE